MSLLAVHRRAFWLGGLALAMTQARALEAPPNAPRSLALAELTSPEIAAAIAAGYGTALVPTGGTEQNGPHMALDKHNRLVAEGARRIAREVGGILVAPVLPFVPEGDPAHPSGNLLFPGTIGLSEASFEAVLDDICKSLLHAGFGRVLLIGDHGQSQPSLDRVAKRFAPSFWSSEKQKVFNIAAWYDDSHQTAMLVAAGETPETIGTHAGLVDTSELLGVAPQDVFPNLAPEGPVSFEAIGATGAPRRANADLGERLLSMRVAQAVAEIRALGPVR